MNARLQTLNAEIAKIPTTTVGKFAGEQNAYLDTAFGLCRVRYIRPDVWAVTDGNGGFGQSFCCCESDPLYLIDTTVAPMERWQELFTARREAWRASFDAKFAALKAEGK